MIKKIPKNNRVVIIPDIHQHIGIVERILKQVGEDYDYVVFLGDYFDCFETPDNKVTYSIEKTCEWLNNKYKELGDKAIWLLGNHDMAYLERFNYRNTKSTDPKNFYYSCSGVTNKKAATINKKLDPEFFYSLELCAVVHNFIVSHAGFSTHHLKPNMSVMESVETLYDDWEKNKKLFHTKMFYWLGEPGVSNGGISGVIGSPIWIRPWELKWPDYVGHGQIVGHTIMRTPEFDHTKNVYFIDTDLKNYIIMNNNKPEIYYV